MVFPDKTRDWLLEKNNPPVRYLTLKHLLKSDREPNVSKDKSQLMDYEVTQGILARADEFWFDDDKAYAKYTGKFWQLIFLGSFLADGKDPRIAEGINGMLSNRKWIWKQGGQCLTANILSSLTRLGYGDHPIVLQEIEVLANRVATDEGIKCDAMEYSLLSHC